MAPSEKINNDLLQVNAYLIEAKSLVKKESHAWDLLYAADRRVSQVRIELYKK